MATGTVGVAAIEGVIEKDIAELVDAVGGVEVGGSIEFQHDFVGTTAVVGDQVVFLDVVRLRELALAEAPVDAAVLEAIPFLDEGTVGGAVIEVPVAIVVVAVGVPAGVVAFAVIANVVDRDLLVAGVAGDPAETGGAVKTAVTTNFPESVAVAGEDLEVGDGGVSIGKRGVAATVVGVDVVELNRDEERDGGFRRIAGIGNTVVSYINAGIGSNDADHVA